MEGIAGPSGYQPRVIISKRKMKDVETSGKKPKDTPIANILQHIGRKTTTPKQGQGGMITIKSYIPERGNTETMKKIFAIAASYFHTNGAANAMVFCNELNARNMVFWPVCGLTRMTMVQEDKQENETEQKYLGVQFANPLALTVKEKMRIAFYKESCPDNIVELTEEEAMKMIEAGTGFLDYLKTLNDKTIAVGESLPGCPEPITLKECSATSKINLIIDQPSSYRKITSVYAPTISIRMMNKVDRPDKKYWFFTKTGVTLSAINFFYMIEAVLKTYIFHVKDTLHSFGDDYYARAEQMAVFGEENLDEWGKTKQNKNATNDSDEPLILDDE